MVATFERSAEDFCEKNVSDLKQNPKTRSTRESQDTKLCFLRNGSLTESPLERKENYVTYW